MRKATFFLVALLLVTAGLGAQSAGTDLNQYYRYPFSVGLFYQSLSPFSAYNTPYTIYDIGADVRVPLPNIPVLQPFGRLGLMRFDSIDATFPQKWDSYHIYGLAGMSYANRFARNFEYGAEASVGLSDAVFPEVVDTGAVSSFFLLLAIGGHIGLDPSYNFSVAFQPSLRYLLALSPLTTFNGLVFSVGLTASYRFGEDPDSARAVIRALRLDQLSLGPAFGAMQSYYADNPLGSVTVTNTERQAVNGLEVFFNQAGYMDSPTPCFTIASLAAGQSVQVPIKAVFNQQVFTTEGKTPLTGEVVAKYRFGNRDVEQREPVSYVLYDKTAITWDDDRKAGAFITPQDGSLRTWTAAVDEGARDASLPALNQPLQVALQVYEALVSAGIQYQEDPSSPFTQVKGKLEAVDSVNLPRTTLKQRYGDCDDLTVMFCTLLETRSIHTGFITVPGHIYAAFDTGVEAESYPEIHPDRGMTLPVNGTLWVPVEVTMLDGRSDFLAAWQRGIELWNQSADSRRFYRTADAHAVYGPVGLHEALIQPKAPDPVAELALVKAARDRLADTVVKLFAAEATRTKGKREYNRLGMAYARFGKYPESIAALAEATKRDPAYVSAQVNLGNVYFLQKKYKDSIATYGAALKTLTAKGSNQATASIAAALLMNLSQVSSAAGDSKAAQDYLAQAQQADPSQATELAAAASGGDQAARAASAANHVMMMDEDQ